MYMDSEWGICVPTVAKEKQSGDGVQCHFFQLVNDPFQDKNDQQVCPPVADCGFSVMPSE
jgi:hypothetical protein